MSDSVPPKLTDAFNHLVLPPRLPTQEDEDLCQVGRNIHERLLDACKILGRGSDPELQHCWTTICHTLDTYGKVNRDMLDKSTLQAALADLVESENRLLICYLAAQNAALLMHRKKDASGATVVVFEAFEASPNSKDVLAAPNALRWQFPFRAIQVPSSDFDDEDFQSALALFLEKAGSEQLPHLAAMAYKAGKELHESRSSGSPALITHMLLSALRAIGSSAKVPFIDKRVHDDVCFSPGGNSRPWRRSPFWLVLRVAAQRQLGLSLGEAVGRAAYKLLISTVLSQLLTECTDNNVEPNLVSLLQRKICQRLAKLEKLRDSRLPAIEKMLRDHRGSLEAAISHAQEYVESAYAVFRERTMRRIPHLSGRIDMKSADFELTLPASCSYLDKIASTKRRVQTASRSPSDDSHLENLHLQSGAASTQKFSQQVLKEAKAIADARTDAARLLVDVKIATAKDAPDMCESIHWTYTLLTLIAKPAVDRTPDYNSQLLLSIFQLWVAMDAAAIVVCPLLGEYEPVFEPHLLNVLQLSSLKDMQCLRSIQDYLEGRKKKSMRGKTIFSPIDSDAFTTRYAESSIDMVETECRIRQQEVKNRQEKQEEWVSVCQTYDEYSQEILKSICICTYDEHGERVFWGCDHCYYKRKRFHLQLQVCEDLLPEQQALAFAIVFELDVPAFFAHYRSMTWAIMIDFAYPTLPPRAPKMYSLQHLPLAKAFSSSSNWGFDVSMASSVKSVSQTHFKIQDARVDFESLLVRLASQFELYDVRQSIWVRDLVKPLTLAHLCRVHVPEPLVRTVLPPERHPAPDPAGPTSYQAVSNRPACPENMSVHEFEAFQRLLSGQSRRWLTMLTELGSSNVNFSKPDAMLVFTQLAAQAGPRHDHTSAFDPPRSDTAETLGVCHAPLTDDHFVRRLLEELKIRLTHIHGNWREISTIETIIALALRVHALATDKGLRRSALTLLGSVRVTALGWMDTLRKKVQDIQERDSGHQWSLYTYRAALACRSTFAIFVEDAQMELNSGDVWCFLRASIAMQQNCVVDVSKLLPHEKNTIRRDCILAHELKDKVHRGTLSFPDQVKAAVTHGIGHDSVMTGGDGGMDEVSLLSWRYLEGENDGWMTSTITCNMRYRVSEQRIDFHYLDGQLLVDGKTIGKLPQDILDADEVKELFGDMHLPTYPSGLHGMTHRLCFPYWGQEVHFGRQEGRVVVLAQARRDRAYHLLEYVPRRIFIGPSNEYDLPRSLVDDCIHWYNQQTGKLEIRRKAFAWKDRINDWKLDILARYAQRKMTYLVDSHSPLFRKVAAVFRHFADVQRLVVVQSLKSQHSIVVDLRHLDLEFIVNGRGLLECRKLRAEIDPNQDAGTLYGFQSMIVLRDVHDHSRRSIITPTGNLKCLASSPHCLSRMQIHESNHPNGDAKNDNNAYARFSIDPILGRLSCPPEPFLLYTKVQLHAFTSCPLPDPLTGRTGEEEAIHTLASGRCQPWHDTSEPCLNIVRQLETLAPLREFYPHDMRVLQEVKWSDVLPPVMQTDRYSRLVRNFIQKSMRLACLSSDVSAPPPEQVMRDGHGGFLLQKRGEVQRRRFELPVAADDAFMAAENKDRLYVASGHTESASPLVSAQSAADRLGSFSQAARSVYQVCRMLRERPDEVHIVRSLTSILNGWPLIGGFDAACDTRTMSLMTFMNSRTFEERWGRLAELCRTAGHELRFELLFSLGLLAFAPDADLDAIRLLAAYTYAPALQSIPPPHHVSYLRFQFQEAPHAATFLRLIQGCYTPPELHLNFQGGNMTYEHQHAIQRHARLCQKAGAQLVAQLMAGWPEAEMPTVADVSAEYIDVKEAMLILRQEWTRLTSNRDLSDYVTKAEEAISGMRKVQQRSLDLSRVTAKKAVAKSALSLVPAPPTIIPSLSDTLASMPMEKLPRYLRLTPPSGLRAARRRNGNTSSATLAVSAEVVELRNIIQFFSGSPSHMRQAYARDLDGSLDALQRLQSQPTLAEEARNQPTEKEVLGRIKHAETVARSTLEHLKQAFSMRHRQGAGQAEGEADGQSAASCLDSYAWLQRGGLWPRLTPVTLLELLRSDSASTFTGKKKTNLVVYGCTITHLQRLHRVCRLLHGRNMAKALAEWQNAGHTNWTPAMHPDWLLMEIDSDFLIRPEQVDVAREIIAPKSNKNSVLQLNMGKGKTSCIVPMAMAALADGNQLARLIVPKSLLLPTAQTVQSRLGGLVGRELRHIPFSRHVATGPRAAFVVEAFKAHHRDLKRRRGILLAAPEHVLAFQLSGLQCLSDGKTELADDMISFQSELSRGMCRDVLDESDFTLAVRTQLVYPGGELSAVDGAPHRWKLVQALLALVEEKLPMLCRDFPNSIGVEKRPRGGFPMVYILNMDIRERLQSLIVEDLSRGRPPFFRMSNDVVILKKDTQTKVNGEDARQIIAHALSAEADNAAIEGAGSLFYDSKTVTEALHLIRGVLVNNILLSCLRKKWNVQYGLHPQRWPIAVPYEAKGVPSERSEFGHPDVAIIFTCLAFYYSGLTLYQLRTSLRHILQQADDPAMEYERWTGGIGLSTLPVEVQNWSQVNVDDEGQVTTLWEHLRLTRPVIDHYLNLFVFPVHARQFSVKLQASAWDLPLFAPGQAPTARTTGFSGTNDNRMMLPLNIKQEDMPELQQTNAEVLTYLLQTRNRHCKCMSDKGRRWTEKQLIADIVNNRIRVLIDAGAYILEKNNESLVREWLAIDTYAQAAIYFGETDNRAWVVFRDKTAKKAPLVATPFADNLDNCLVYFDEAHTRGVDLQLPEMCTGALTLALGQTKDHTVQAAMRMRQLGTSQRVVFYSPLEVDQSIRDLCQSARAPLDSSHVITWLLEQTCQANEQLQSLYLSHGLDFCRRSSGQLRYESRVRSNASRRTLLGILERPERLTLAQLYGHRSVTQEGPSFNFAVDELQAFSAELATMKHAVVDGRTAAAGDSSGHGGGSGAFEEVEQEREVEAQVEQVREREERPRYGPLSFRGTAPEIRRFVQTGHLVPGSWRRQAFSFIAATNIGIRYGVRETSSNLFVTAEFGRTVHIGKKTLKYQDDFLRPVEWMLWCPWSETGLVVIAEELESVMDMLRKPRCEVHLVSCAAAVTRSMIRFGSLKYFSQPALPQGYEFPSWLLVELGILAGRLYMTFEDCEDMTAYMRKAGQSGFNMTGFLLDWLSLRRVGQDMMHTPAAYVCQGRHLVRDHAFFAQEAIEADPVESSGSSRTTRSDSRGSDSDNRNAVSAEYEVEDQEQEELGTDDPIPESWYMEQMQRNKRKGGLLT